MPVFAQSFRSNRKVSGGHVFTSSSVRNSFSSLEVVLGSAPFPVKNRRFSRYISCESWAMYSWTSPENTGAGPPLGTNDKWHSLAMLIALSRYVRVMSSHLRSTHDEARANIASSRRK